MKLFTPKISLLICVVCLIFVSSLTAANPYNALDVAALKAFFEQPSAVQNKTNGEQLGLPASLPDDDSWIATLAGRIRWGAISGDVTQEQRLRAFNVVNANLSGMLDLRVCYWLEELNCPNNRLTGLKLSELSAQLLRSLNTDGNCLRLVELPLLGWDYGRQYIAGETINYDNGDTMDFSDSMVIGGKNTDFIVSSGGNTLVETVDYTMENGILRIINPNLIGQTLSVYLINESFIYPNTMEVHLVRFTGTPATYHPDDVQALRTFLEQRSLTGPPYRTNSERFPFLTDVLPNNNSWVDNMVHYERIEWTDDYPYKRLKAVHFSGTPANSLFLSGVLDLSVCDKLETLNCANNLLTGIRLSDTADEVLTTLNAHNNSMYLSALPLSGRTYGTQYISGSTVNYVDYQTGLDFSEEAIIEGVETTFELTNLLVENVDYTVQNGVLRFDPKLIGTSLGCAIRNTNFPNTMALYWFTVIDAAAGDTPILANMPQIYSRNGYVFIDNNNSRMVQIYDINGRMTVEGNSGKFAVPDGIYVVKTEGIVVKLIVND